MRKVLATLTVLTAFGLIACKKCQTCNTATTQTVSGSTYTTNSSQEYCGQDYDDAPEEANVSQNAGGVQQTVVITCQEN